MAYRHCMQDLGKTPMEFFVHNFIIHGRAARCKPKNESDTMKDTILDILTAVALGLVFAGFALAYFDILTY